MGLLGDSWEDPRTAAILNLAGGLLSQRNLGAGLVQGMQGYTSAMLAAKKAQQEEEERKALMAQRALQLRELEGRMADAQRAREEAAAAKQARGSFLDSIDPNAGPAMPLSVPQAMRAGLGLQEIQALEARQRAEAAEAFRRSIPNPQAQALGSLGADASPTAANAARMQPVDPRQQLMFDAMKAGQISPMDYLNSTAPKAPEFKVVGNSLVQVGGGQVKEAFRAPDKPEAAPAAVREYQFAVSQGYPGSFQQFQLEQKRAGATNVSVPINTAKPLLNTMAEGLGKQIDANLGAARAAVDTIGGAQRIRTLLDSGQVVTGPGADWRIAARQVGSVLGVGGKDNDEVLANTRKTMQQLAQFELDAAQSMKGQGAITEPEREILRRAAAGMITFTQPELKALSTTLEERARKRIRVHNQDVDRLGQMPEGSQLVPFYRVSEPGAGNTVDDIVNRYRSR